MKFDVVSKLSSAGHAAESFVKKKWDESAHSTAGKAARAEAAARAAEELRRREERNQFFELVAAKCSSSSAEEMPPLICNPGTAEKAVFLVTRPIAFGKFELSKKTYKLLAKHVGMSLDSVSHWLVGVIDRGFGTCYYYELMSDQLELNLLGKNYFRMGEIDAEYIDSWNSCFYVGETTKSHTEIEELGTEHMVLHPRYSLLSNNCQDMVENLVKSLCNGKVISQAKLREELKLASPRIALDLMVARLRSRMDKLPEHADIDKVKNEHKDVSEDVDTIKALLHKVHHR
ncbi:hypothetical protein BX600DRAFT_460246 [Xylariales sp. PMI_506]|nr:hypothetical protein BX600DRAFT_460246 [Xylariales sp. PMI_506]